ncbi:MAG: response regulator transcription factor [Bacteroidia bacterium]|nr:response regulator transcription factor [Bacteroidia bacterium]
MNVLIIEDEAPGVEKLERYLQKYSNNIKVIHKIESVENSVNWLKQHQSEIDLIFMDIQLTDGQSFKIFDQIKVEKPVVFITAFNEYALDAFKVNGIDYLLKPITYSDLSASLQKLENLKSILKWGEPESKKIKEVLSTLPIKNYKNRFMVKLGDHIRSFTSDQISFFFADGRDVYLITNQLRKFIIDYTLESLEDILDPKIFHRCNRSYILNITAIQDVIVYSNSRLKVLPTVKWENEIIVSREKVTGFKEWFDGMN